MAKAPTPAAEPAAPPAPAVEAPAVPKVSPFRLAVAAELTDALAPQDHVQRVLIVMQAADEFATMLRRLAPTCRPNVADLFNKLAAAL